MTEYIYDYRNPSYKGLIYTATHPDTDKQFDYFGETAETFSDRMKGYKYFGKKKSRPIIRSIRSYANQFKNGNKQDAFDAFNFKPFCSIWLPTESTEDPKEIGIELESDFIVEYKTNEKDGGLNGKKIGSKGSAGQTGKKKWYNDGKQDYLCVVNDARIEEYDLKPGRVYKPNISPEGKKKIKQALTGIKRTDEQKANMSAAQKGHSGTTNGCKIYNDGATCYFCKEGDSIIEELGLVLGRLDKRNKTGIFLPTTQGKKAYNDGVRDYFLFEDDPKIKQLNLQKGGKTRTEINDK